jgi:hypothetical protein
MWRGSVWERSSSMNEFMDNLKTLDLSQELIIIAVVIIVVFMGDKDIANVATGGLIGYLTKKSAS